MGSSGVVVQITKKIDKNGLAYIILLMQPPAVPLASVVVSLMQFETICY